MPGYGSRFWADRTGASRRRSYPRFRGRDDADVVVIGGGLTGATTAYVLAQAGVNVVLVEAERIASGGTAGSLGVILPQPDAWFRTVETAAGLRHARAAWKDTRRSAIEFASALKKLPTKSDLASSALVINARWPEEAEALRKERDARKKAGLDAAWLSADAAHAQLATESSGAIRLREAFTFDPVRATLGLVGAAAAKGARVFERSVVRRTKFTRKDAQVILSTGVIRTRAIVVATGEPGSAFAQLRRHVRRANGYFVVTQPLPAAMRRETGGHDAVMTEVGEAPHWLRWLPDGRALFAGEPSAPVGSRLRDTTIRQRTAQLMYELSVRHPAISGLPAEWGWDAPIVTTTDGLPWIGPHRNYPFHFFALAFGWHGDSLAWFAGRAALRFVRGETRREDEAFGFLRQL